MATERGVVRSRVLAIVSAFVLTAALAIGDGTAVAAPTIDYPTWSDVRAARASEAKTRAAVARIKALLQQLEANLTAARADEIAKGEAYERAQDAYDQQVIVADELLAQADAAKGDAEVARERATRLLALLAKSGDGDLVAQLLSDDQEGADSLLYRLEAMDRLSAQSDKVYAEALRLQNTAQALTDQADIAEVKREELRGLAEDALAAARAATVAAEAALRESEEHKVELTAQLEVLIEKRQATEADYRKGVIAREKARKEAERKRREAAEREAAAGGVNSLGWARPSAGYISSHYGNRYHPIYHTWRLHNGTDIAGQGCGAPIRAVHAGTVTYAGWNGTLGNYVQIAHGDGTSSGYGHIIGGGILVGYGQHVVAGQQIARVGSTGASTGCHVHFIIRVNGQLTNPVPFMRARGVILG